jgi:uncharacterized membrane protein HdeD (DUF308 family)
MEEILALVFCLYVGIAFIVAGIKTLVVGDADIEDFVSSLMISTGILSLIMFGALLIELS